MVWLSQCCVLRTVGTPCGHPATHDTLPHLPVNRQALDEAESLALARHLAQHLIQHVGQAGQGEVRLVTDHLLLQMHIVQDDHVGSRS